MNIKQILGAPVYALTYVAIFVGVLIVFAISFIRK